MDASAGRNSVLGTDVLFESGFYTEVPVGEDL